MSQLSGEQLTQHIRIDVPTGKYHADAIVFYRDFLSEHGRSSSKCERGTQMARPASNQCLPDQPMTHYPDIPARCSPPFAAHLRARAQGGL